MSERLPNPSRSHRNRQAFGAAVLATGLALSGSACSSDNAPQTSTEAACYPGQTDSPLFPGYPQTAGQRFSERLLAKVTIVGDTAHDSLEVGYRGASGGNYTYSEDGAY